MIGNVTARCYATSSLARSGMGPLSQQRRHVYRNGSLLLPKAFSQMARSRRKRCTVSIESQTRASPGQRMWKVFHKRAALHRRSVISSRASPSPHDITYRGNSACYNKVCNVDVVTPAVYNMLPYHHATDTRRHDLIFHPVVEQLRASSRSERQEARMLLRHLRMWPEAGGK